MSYKAPGKHYREGLSTRQFFQLFPDDKTAEAYQATLAGRGLLSLLRGHQRPDWMQA